MLIQTKRAICRLMKSGSESISNTGFSTTFANNVDKNVRNGRQAKSASGNVKYKIVSVTWVKYSEKEGEKDRSKEKSVASPHSPVLRHPSIRLGTCHRC